MLLYTALGALNQCTAAADAARGLQNHCGRWCCHAVLFLALPLLPTAVLITHPCMVLHGAAVQYDVVLGRGAFKTVFKAFDEAEGIEVAWNQVKVNDLANSPAERERLFAEIRVLKQLKHKNIMSFYDSWLDQKNLTINFITELFTSGTLRQ